MATRVTLPDEAEDMTVSELHQLVLNRLVDALRTVFGSSALVLSEIFLRVHESDPVRADQVSPDVLIIPGARVAHRTVYRVPDEPVPDVTVEVMSRANYEAEGRAQLEHKRELLGRIGVPTHIEIDPDRGFVTVWRNNGGALGLTGPPDDRYDGPALGGLRIELSPGEVLLWMPTGREYLDAAAETARAAAETTRADAEQARADAEQARADAATARAERLAALVRRHGIDLDAGVSPDSGD
ncbi:MAG: Uma2 family endonuclease [Acidimicrobiales bacterium]